MIEFKNISFSYGKKRSELSKINLKIKKGEFIVLSGPSGSGKTTLTRMINKLAPEFYGGTYQGDILINDKHIETYTSADMPKYVASVFQDPKSQFFSSIVEDELAMMGENFGVEEKQLKKLIKQTAKNYHISHLLHQDIAKLSSGQKQIVAIASVTVIDHDIYVFDEPSANLDFASTLKLGKILKQLKQLGKTIIVSEHRLFYLKDLFDRFIYLKDGHIIWMHNESEMKQIDFASYALRQFELKALKARKKAINTNICYEVKALDVAYKKHVLLHDVNFSMKKQEVMAIIGKNGTGKSSLAHILVGLKKYKKGNIYFNEKKFNLLKHTYYVMPDADKQLFFESVIKEMMGINHSKAQKEKAIRILKQLELDKFIYKHPQKLSIGQKQRLVVGAAFMQDKPIIILDEPTAGLDLHSMTLISNLIDNQLAKKTYQIMVITHDLEFLFKTCHSALILDRTSEKINIDQNEDVIKSFFNIS